MSNRTFKIFARGPGWRFFLCSGGRRAQNAKHGGIFPRPNAAGVSLVPRDYVAGTRGGPPPRNLRSRAPLTWPNGSGEAGQPFELAEPQQPGV